MIFREGKAATVFFREGEAREAAKAPALWDRRLR